MKSKPILRAALWLLTLLAPVFLAACYGPIDDGYGLDADKDMEVVSDAAEEASDVAAADVATADTAAVEE